MLFIYWNKSFSYFLFFSFSFFFFFSRTHIRISRNIYYYSIRILQSDGGQKTHMFDTCRYKSLARRRDANHLLSRVFSDFVEKFGSRETVNVEAHKSRGYLSLSLPFSDARHWFVDVDRVATIFDGNRHGQWRNSSVSFTEISCPLAEPGWTKSPSCWCSRFRRAA